MLACSCLLQLRLNLDNNNNVLNLHKVGGLAGNISEQVGGRVILVIILGALAVGGRLEVVYK